MDVLLGPTFTLDVPSSPPPPPPPYDADPPTSDAAPSYAFFPADSSDSSSSIGTPDQSDNDEDEEENDAVSSKRNENDENNDDEEVHTKLKTLASLDSLEEALPIKRGLSNHFIGKSKSFSDLSQVNTVKELQKQENPFNKRRRVLMASKLKKRSSFYAWSNPKSMPLLPVHEDEDDYDDEEEEEKEKQKKVPPSSSSSSSSSQVPMSYVYHMRRRLGSFKCRSLSDLKEHDEEEEEEIEDEDNDD